ncbi:MAG: DNA repair protein RecO [Chthoniobacterales bacterium]
MHQATALLLRRYRLSETSLIIVWFTTEYGKIKTTARGALQSNGAFAGRLELFSTAEIGFKLSKKNDLHFLQEVISPSLQPRVASNYLTLLCASYFAELCDLLTESMHAVPEIFGLLRRAFYFLQEQKPTQKAVDHFEKEFAKILGIYDPSMPAFHSLSRSLDHLPANRERLLSHLAKI